MRLHLKLKNSHKAEELMKEAMDMSHQVVSSMVQGREGVIGLSGGSTIKVTHNTVEDLAVLNDSHVQSNTTIESFKCTCNNLSSCVDKNRI